MDPNRHQVVLGRTYKATSYAKYTQRADDQLTSWLDATPDGHCMNWCLYCFLLFGSVCRST
ncbi:MAG: hypothetical protein GY951_12925 [Psychromonas sp.]|nr:hypothetical protein [Alteromonadales bacterium]MCP5078944.1 hypothetical protein [Psychromonas sp.]